MADGSARCWGNGESGQLGDGAAVSRPLPATVQGLTAAVTIAPGADHTCALLASGGAACWGANFSGQLGSGSTAPRLTATPVTTVKSGATTTLANTAQLAAGGQHNCAVQASGALQCWGDNTNGQLGSLSVNPSILDRAIPASSFTLNIDPRVTLDGDVREATGTVLGLCDAGQQLRADVALNQGAVIGRGTAVGDCTGGLERYPVTVRAEGGAAFRGGLAQVDAEASIVERGAVADTQEWTRQVEIVGGGASLEGKASAVGTGQDKASIRVNGQFTATAAVALGQATLTLTSLLDEVGGAGELTRAAAGASLLPLVLSARSGGTATEATYETPTGVRPSVKVELKNRDPERGLIEYSIAVDRATIPVAPSRCAGSPSATRLRTRLFVQVGGGTPIGIDATVPWRCKGTALQTP